MKVKVKAPAGRYEIQEVRSQTNNIITPPAKPKPKPKPKPTQKPKKKLEKFIGFSNLPPINPIASGSVKKKFTIILAGMARGGTSLTAAVLDGCGIAMDGSEDGHFERIEFKNNNGVNNQIVELNEKYDRWGVQLHLSQVKKMLRKFRNPVLVLTFRDFVAVLQRRISSGDYKKINLKQMKSEYNMMYSLMDIKTPRIFLSYERLKYEPELMVKQITNFLNIEYTDEVLKRIGSGYLLQVPKNKRT